MSFWDSIKVREENKEKGDTLKKEVRKKGSQVSHDDIYEKGVEELAEDMGVRVEEEKKEKKRDFMELF